LEARRQGRGGGGVSVRSKYKRRLWAEELGRRVCELRCAFDMTQEELAKALGVDHAHVSRIEAGKRDPSLALLRRIADVFGADLEINLNGRVAELAKDTNNADK